MTQCVMLLNVSQSDELLTSTQSGVILGKSGQTVIRMMRKGLLAPATQLSAANGVFLFRRSDVEALAAERAAS